MFAAINLSLQGLLELVLYIGLIGGVCWLLIFLIDYWKLPEPFNKVAKIIVMTVAVILLINELIGFFGGQTPVRWR